MQFDDALGRQDRSTDDGYVGYVLAKKKNTTCAHLFHVVCSWCEPQFH